MKGLAKLTMFALGLLSSGCALVCDGVHVVGTEVADSVSDVLEQVRNRKWARGAWNKILSSEPHAYSEDYARGFKDGFAAFLSDGQGEPPALAPARYRRIAYQTPQGYHAIEDWFAGYNRGVAAAIDTGCRRWVTGPLAASLAPLPSAAGTGPDHLPPWPGIAWRAKIGTPRGVDSDLTAPVTKALTPPRLSTTDAKTPTEMAAPALGAPQLSAAVGVDRTTDTTDRRD